MWRYTLSYLASLLLIISTYMRYFSESTGAFWVLLLVLLFSHEVLTRGVFDDSDVRAKLRKLAAEDSKFLKRLYYKGLSLGAGSVLLFILLAVAEVFLVRVFGDVIFPIGAFLVGLVVIVQRLNKRIENVNCKNEVID